MTDSIWEVFRDTGDPLCYLIYRAENRLELGIPNEEKPLSVAAESISRP
jgi:hypothetical protein